MGHHPNSLEAMAKANAASHAAAMARMEQLRADILRDHDAGLNCDALRAKYHMRTSTVLQVLQEAGVNRALKSRARRGRPMTTLVNRHGGLGGCPCPEDWAYIASMFEGDGSISFRSPQQGNVLGQYGVSIAQNGTELHDWLLATIGAGRVTIASNNERMHIFQLRGQRAVFEFLCGVRPYLRVKRVRVEEALEVLATKYGWTVPEQGSPVPPLTHSNKLSSETLRSLDAAHLATPKIHAKAI